MQPQEPWFQAWAKQGVHVRVRVARALTPNDAIVELFEQLRSPIGDDIRGFSHLPAVRLPSHEDGLPNEVRLKLGRFWGNFKPGWNMPLHLSHCTFCILLAILLDTGFIGAFFSDIVENEIASPKSMLLVRVLLGGCSLLITCKFGIGAHGLSKVECCSKWCGFVNAPHSPAGSSWTKALKASPADCLCSERL